MRLKFWNVIFALCLIVITSILFYILILQTNSNNGDKYGLIIEREISRLEDNISKQVARQNQLINDLKDHLFSQDIINKKNHEKKDNSNKIPVLVFACNRVGVNTCLDKILQYRPSAERFPIVVSQDCEHEETTQKIQSYGSQLTLIHQPDQSDIDIPLRERKFKGYFKIARHYGWALNQIFYTYNYTSVIIVEDDLEIAPDFFEYFLGTYSLLKKDPSLWCISAWNDNGKKDLINLKKPEVLYRSDFFPGLGWMMTKDLWMELSPKWPRAYWDDWIREPKQRKGRSCIRPEISRTRTFGKKGVSNGMFFEKHLKYITLNTEFVPFTTKSMDYLLKENYDKDFVAKVYQSAVVNVLDDLKENKIPGNSSVRLLYRSREEYKYKAKAMGIMDDFKSGVPRTAYKGIVTFHFINRTVHLAPNLNWNGYDPKWS